MIFSQRLSELVHKAKACMPGCLSSEHAWKRVLYLLAVAGVITFISVKPMEFWPNPGMVNAGEKLMHPEISSSIPIWYMPLGNVASALANHRVCLKKLILLLCVLLAFTLGSLLHSFFCGLIAAVLSLFLCYRGGPPDFEQLMYSMALLLTANFLAAVFSSSQIKNLFIGLAIGVSLFVKGVLVLFPLAIFVYEMFARRRQDFKRFLKDIFPVLFIPCLIIVLWGCANYFADGKFILLEDGQKAHSNIITGALGLICTVEGNIHVLADISGDENILLWAAGEILHHPFRYLIAMTQRLWFVISLHPGLFLGSLIALWRFRKNREFILAGLLAGYFLFIHCLMTVESRYFIPLWFLLCPLSASLVDFICDTGMDRRTIEGQKAALTIVWLCFVPVFMLFSFTLGLVITYPAVGKIKVSDLRSIIENSDNPWLWSELGHYYAEKGDWDDALPALEKSYRLNPDANAKKEYLLALFASDNHKHTVVNGMSFEDFLTSGEMQIYQMLVMTLIRLEEGNYKNAEEMYRQAVTKWESENCMFRKATTPYELKLLDTLRSKDTGLVTGKLGDILMSLSLERSLNMTNKLPRISVDNAGLLRETAMRLRNRGKYEQALNLIEQLLARDPASRVYLNDLGDLLNELSPERRVELVKKMPHISAGYPGALRELAMRLQDMGEYEQSLNCIEQLLSQHPANAVYLNDRGVLKMLMNKPFDAIMAFESAISMDPHYLPAYLSLAMVHISQGREDKALKVYELALERNRSAEKSDMYERISRNFKSLNSRAGVGTD